MFSIFFLLMCMSMLMGTDDCNPTEASRQAVKKTANVNRLMEKQPTPEIGYSMDRFLLDQRLERFNDPNKMSYLYIVLLDGTWLQVTIVGKLASTSKRLTPTEECSASYGCEEQPDEMGTWGSSDPAKVGMSTLGSLLETGGFISYIYSEAPLNFKNLDRQIIEIEVQATETEKREFNTRLETAKKLR